MEYTVLVIFSLTGFLLWLPLKKHQVNSCGKGDQSEDLSPESQELKAFKEVGHGRDIMEGSRPVNQYCQEAKKPN